MNNHYPIFLLLFLIVPIFNTNLTVGHAQDQQQGLNYPEMQRQTFNLTKPLVLVLNPGYKDVKFNHTGGSFIYNFTTLSFNQLADVTIVSAHFTENENLFDYINFTASLNSFKSTNYYYFTDFQPSTTLNFIVDDSSHAYLNNENHITIQISVGFKNITQGFDLFPNPYEQMFLVTLDGLSIETTWRQQFNPSDSLNANNSHITALIINPSYLVPTGNILFPNLSFSLSGYNYWINFALILPKGIDQNSKQCYFNLTINYNFDLIILNIFMQNFAIVSTTTTAKTVTYLMRYVSDTPKAVAYGSFEFIPKVENVYYMELTGQLFVADQSLKLYPGSNEMDMVLFVTVTIVIPLSALAKLIYRRFFY